MPCDRSSLATFSARWTVSYMPIGKICGRQWEVKEMRWKVTTVKTVESRGKAAERRREVKERQ